jgi:hypothetical protein
MRKILLFITFHFSLLAGAQQTPAWNTDTSSGKFPGTVCGTYKSNPTSVFYIVDGVRYTAKKFSSISPEDIENLQVLKGEAAAKLYGPSAALVISITTKKKSGYIVVRDREDKKPLASASLVFNESSQVVNRIAEEDGRVHTKNITHGKMPVEVSCVGYKKKTVMLDISKNSVHEIELERDYNTLGEVVVVSYLSIRRCRIVLHCGGNLIADTLISTAAFTAPSATPTQNYLQVYPNPSKSNASIYLRLPSETGNSLRAELLNASGQIIKTITLPSSKAASFRFGLPQLTAGMYYVRVTDAGLGKSYVGNLVVE